MKFPRTHAAPLPLLHACFLFSGAGTLLLGPILPLFAGRWGLHDSQSGALIGAQFFGLFTGAISLFSRLRRSLLSGTLCAAAGFCLLAAASLHEHGFLFGVGALFTLGFGLGQITTTVNLLSAIRYPDPRKRSAVLSLLNFTWSAGAVLSPLVAALFIARFTVFALLLCFATTALCLFLTISQSMPSVQHAATPDVRRHGSRIPGMALPLLVLFVAIFFLYGGLEATVSDWLSTYTLRYTTLGLAAAASSTTALWAAFTLGRAGSSWLLVHVPERAVRTAGLCLAVCAIIALRQAHTGRAISVCAAIIGLGLAPFFAVTFSLLMVHAPRPRQAGTAMSMIGLGSAVFPYLVGLVSTRMHSLQLAMGVPVVIAFTLLLLCAWSVRPQRLESSQSSPSL